VSSIIKYAHTMQNYYPILEYGEASDEVKAIYDDTMRTLQLPFVLNWFKHQGSNPGLLRANWHKLKHTLMEGNVPNVLKQLIVHNISAQKDCSYCAKAHRVFANSMAGSISDAIDFDLTANLDHTLIPDSYRSAIEVVTNAALYPEKVNETHFETLAKAGFTEDEIVELMAQADLTNMLNTIAFISGAKLDNELIEIEA
jgi:uncharacterized peroxidase-related enzyme